MASNLPGRLEETLGSVLIAKRANRCPAEPAYVTPPLGVVTENRRIKRVCTSLRESDKVKDESGTKDCE